jgi:hypothetical protein
MGGSANFVQSVDMTGSVGAQTNPRPLGEEFMKVHLPAEVSTWRRAPT